MYTYLIFRGLPMMQVQFYSRISVDGYSMILKNTSKIISDIKSYFTRPSILVWETYRCCQCKSLIGRHSGEHAIALNDAHSLEEGHGRVHVEVHSHAEVVKQAGLDLSGA